MPRGFNLRSLQFLQEATLPPPPPLGPEKSTVSIKFKKDIKKKNSSSKKIWYEGAIKAGVHKSSWSSNIKEVGPLI